MAEAPVPEALKDLAPKERDLVRLALGRTHSNRGLLWSASALGVVLLWPVVSLVVAAWAGTKLFATLPALVAGGLVPLLALRWVEARQLDLLRALVTALSSPRTALDNLGPSTQRWVAFIRNQPPQQYVLLCASIMMISCSVVVFNVAVWAPRVLLRVDESSSAYALFVAVIPSFIGAVLLTAPLALFRVLRVHAVLYRVIETLDQLSRGR